MSIEAHLATLTAKREQLKTRINEEMTHPHPDFTLITRLKKQNLQLKEEMQRYLRQAQAASSATS